MTIYEGQGLSVDTTTWTWNWSFDGSSLWFHTLICIAYCLSVFGFQQWRSSQSEERMIAVRKAMDPIRFYHNASLSVVSLLMFLVMIYSSFKDGRFNSWHDMACRNTPNTGIYGHANMIYLVTKIWEWVDTFFLILWDKPLITLHYFHHMTTFTMAAVVHNFPVGGYCWINSLVHFVMYAHYSKPQQWARKSITTLQITQFVSVISVHTYGFYKQFYGGNYGKDCFNFENPNVMKEWWYCQSVVVIYFLLFCKFYVDNYASAKSSKSKAKKR